MAPQSVDVFSPSSPSASFVVRVAIYPVVSLALCVASPPGAWALPDPAPVGTTMSGRAVEGPEVAGLGWGQSRRGALLSRVGRSSRDILLGVRDWSQVDWLRFGGLMAVPVALTWPAAPSMDARLHGWIDRHRERVNPRFFPYVRAGPLSLGVAGALLGVAGLGTILDDDRWFEYDALMMEALAVSQLYVVMGKFMTGRDSAYVTGSQGHFHGPTRMRVHGTPSGHAATVYSLLSVSSWYWRSSALHALTHVIGLYWGADILYNRQHWASDVVCGSLLGYFVGKWVVDNHARQERMGGTLSPLAVLPMGIPEGAGLAVSQRF